MTMQLHVLSGNPGKKKRATKKGAKKGAKKTKAKRKPMAKKKKAAKKRSTIARAVAAVKKRVRRAVKNPGHKRLRKRRRNPSAKAMLGGLKKTIPSTRELAGLALGVLATSAATKALSDGAPIFSGSGPSSLAGEPWNVKQYGAALAVATVGAAVAEKVVKGSGHAVATAAIVFAIAKTVMPLAAKAPMLQKYLGEAEGEVKVDDDGQSWIMQGGRWQALQGLVQATPMDGQLEEQNALDGLVMATPMDGYDDDWGITTSNLSVNG